ncbi:MAG: hypothetical protein B6I31_02435 [Desulfobacteraceae bacterium 4572_19]|nr:MAG: hypothetical protein B6I31_02435 [Desulfobacteraceae bacterium 4572_19]
MESKLHELFKKLRAEGLTSNQAEKIMRQELASNGEHCLPDANVPVRNYFSEDKNTIYGYGDLLQIQDFSAIRSTGTLLLQSLDDLLDRDKQREKDGFPRKIRMGRLVKPGKDGKDKVVVVPSTVEEKLVHDSRPKPADDSDSSDSSDDSSGGTGEGEEGEVIGEQPIHEPDGSGEGPGEGDSGNHDIESNAYDLGKILSEQFELPNLKDKGKKRSLTRYTYDLTDRNRGFGQFLDKKATLKKIVETNINLGNLPDVSDIQTENFIISPKDLVYRILSREKEYESQAMIFFLRDYSGSMSGKPTQLVVAQHVLIYSWLLFQYDKQVESRFILHDTEAKEVDDFYTYYNSKVAGGTRVASAFKLVNQIVEEESLATDYNIYVFHGTDGDDWDRDGNDTIVQIKKMMSYVNRIGITVARHSYAGNRKSEVEEYMDKSKLLTSKSDLIRLDFMEENADDARLIEGIKKLISQ